MADAPVADAEREAETPPEEPLSEDETCIDSGAFKKHFGFTATNTGKQVLLDILKAMVKQNLEKATFALLPKGGDYKKSNWLAVYLDSNAAGAAVKRRLLKFRHDAIKVWNKDRRAEQEESDEASSDDDSAASSEPDLSNVVLDDVPLPPSIKRKYETEIKLCVHYKVDFSQFQGKAAKYFRSSDFTSAWKRAKGLEIERRTTSREGAGQQKEEQKRCGECDACLSMVQPPPGCECPACKRVELGSSAVGTCREVRKARENPPRCEKLAQDNLPAVGADEQGSAHLGDPLTLEERKLRDVAELIRENSDADLRKLAPNVDRKLQAGTAKALSLAVPGMPATIGYVLRLLGDDTTKADLGEHVATHLKLCDYLDDDEKTRNEMIRLARAAAIAPDEETEPPPTPSIMHRRAWTRIAKALCRQQREEILALPKGSDALGTWLRTRAQFAVDWRSEYLAKNGALADWTIGQAAALKANRENMFNEKLKGERYNNTEPFRLARNETHRTDVTDNVPRLRETGPRPPSSR